MAADPKALCGGICFAFLVVISIIIFAVCMANYVHLGPDDQVLLKRPTGKYVQNGPWNGQLNPFHDQEWRKAVLIDTMQYAEIEDILTGQRRLEAGPKLLFLGPYDEVKKRFDKIVLEKHEYVRLTDKGTGVERIVSGPTNVVPTVTEVATEVQQAVFVNRGSAVVVRNKLTGTQTLVTSCTLPAGVWFPQPQEEVVDIRDLIFVLPHEAMLVRDVDGKTTVYSGRESSAGDCAAGSGGVGGTSFFLPPYSKIVRMRWSRYGNVKDAAIGAASTTMDPGRRLEDAPSLEPAAGAAPVPEGQGEATEEPFEPEEAHPDYDGLACHRLREGSGRRLAESDKIYVYDEARGVRRLESIYVDVVSPSVSSAPKRTVTAIDLRTQKSFYVYEVRTNDNVRLVLEGTIFWRIVDVDSMLRTTSDPEADVWSKSRSTLIAASSAVDLATFMTTFNDLVLSAFDGSRNSTFWQDRGIEMISIELNNYRPLDAAVAATLQSIIRQSVRRMNELQKQESQNDVLREKLMAEKTWETNRTHLLEQQAENSKITAETSGAVFGGQSAATINTFMDTLEPFIDNTTERLGLYTFNKRMQSSQLDLQQLTSGEASLYMSPKDVELRLQMPGAHASTAGSTGRL